MQDHDNERLVGRVAWTDARGFCFVRVGGEQRRVFCHSVNVTDRAVLEMGDTVRFQIELTDRGPRCINVEKIT